MSDKSEQREYCGKVPPLHLVTDEQSKQRICVLEPYHDGECNFQPPPFPLADPHYWRDRG